MLNLLPPAEKKRIHHEAFVRLCTALSATVIVASVFGSLILYAAKLYMEGRVMEIKTEQAKAARSIPAGMADLNKEAVLTEKKIRTLLPESDLSLVEIIKKISVDKPSGVAISGFSYNFKDPKNADVTVAAVADNRESILRFADNLRKEVGFIHVDVPVSNFAKDTNIGFSLSLSVTF